MRKYSRISAILFALLFSVQAFGQVRVQGKVVDQDGKPIEGAVVILSSERFPEQDPVPTNRYGKWAATVPFGGAWEIDITKEGYHPFLGRVNVSEAGRMPPLPATMQKKVAAPPPEPEPVEEEEVVSKVPPEAVQAVSLAEAYARRAEGKATEEDLAMLDIMASAETLPPPTPDERIELYRQAISEFEKAHALLPEHIELKKALARAYYAVGDIDPAISLLETVHKTEPDNVGISLLLVNLYAEGGKVQKARELLDSLPGDTLGEPTAVINVGILFLNQGESEEAYRYFDRAIEIAPDRGESYYYRGIASLQMENMDDAKADFRKVIELAPDSGEAADAQAMLDQF